MLLTMIDRFIKNLENGLAYLLTFSIVCIVTAQVVFRFVLSKPLSWSQEVATYLLIWIVLIGMVIAQREKANIAIHMLTHYLAKYDRVLRWIPWITMVLLFGVFGYGGAMISIEHSMDKSPTIGMPMWIVYMAFPFAAVLGLWHLFMDLRRLMVAREEKNEWLSHYH